VLFKSLARFGRGELVACARFFCLGMLVFLAACSAKDLRYARGEPAPGLRYSDFSLNWDGTKIAFDFWLVGNSSARIAIFDFESKETRIIVGSHRIFSPRFSPSGRYLTFVARCAEYPDHVVPRCPEGQLGPVIVVFDMESGEERFLPAEGSYDVWRPTYGGEAPNTFSFGASGSTKAMPIFSHDERSIYYLSSAFRPDARRAWNFSPRVIDLQTEEDRFVLDEDDDALYFGRAGIISPSGDGRYVIFGRSGYDGVRQAEYRELKAFGFFLNEADDLEERVISGTELAHDPRYRGKIRGSMMITGGRMGPMEIYGVGSGAGSYVREEIVFTFRSDIFVFRVEELIRIGGAADFGYRQVTGISLSGDGRVLALIGTPLDEQKTTVDIWLLDMDTGERRQVTLPLLLSPTEDGWGPASPDEPFVSSEHGPSENIQGG